MSKIYKFAGVLSQSACQNQRISTRNQIDWKNVAIIHRWYSKKNERDRGGKCPPCEEKPKCAPKPVSPECKPKTLHPCAPCPPPPNCYKQLNDCKESTRRGVPPKVICPYDEKKRKKGYGYLVLGTLVLLAALGALYSKVQPPKKLSKKDKQLAEAEKKKGRQAVILKDPAISKEIPGSVPYLLIGGGTASFAAFRAIKSADPQAKVLVISNEGDFPYMRPPLSKEIWFNEDKEAVKNLTFKQWNGSERSLFYEPDDFYVSCQQLISSENGGVAVARGWSVSHIDVVERKAFLEDGYVINYDKCLIATGALPKNLDIFDKAEQVIKDKVTLYRNIFDFQELYEITEDARSIAVIGGGFLGSELACALARKGKNKIRIYQIFREGGNMGKILPEYLTYWTTEKVKSEGVEVVPFAEVTGVKFKEKDNNVQLTLSNKLSVTVDHVIVAIGAEPNTDLAEKSELEVDPELGGFLVNTELQARSNLFIAGDCACFYDTKLGRRRVEHHDHAVVSGRLAGENMTGAAKPYWHQSMFWSDLGPDVGYEAIGIVDSSLPTVGVFAKASSNDNPKAVVTATDEGLRSTTEERIPAECEKYLDDPETKQIMQQQRRSISMAQDGEDFGKGVVFYLRNDIVVGIVLWNVFNRMNVARQVLKDECKYDDLNEVAKLFSIHDE